MIDRESNLAQAYLYHRQAYDMRTAQRAFDMAVNDVKAEKRRYAHGKGYKYGGNWQTLGTFGAFRERAYFCDDWPSGWRHVGRTDEVARREDHRSRELRDSQGWYTDDDYSATLEGHVLQLPARDGKPVYLPAMRHTDADGVTIYPLDQYDDPIEAAYAAYRYAEIAAEQERDYQRGWYAGSMASELQQENDRLRRQGLQLFADLKTVKRSFVVSAADDALTRLCGTIRAEIIAIRRQIQSNCRKIEDLKNNHGGTDEGFANGFTEG